MQKLRRHYKTSTSTKSETTWWAKHHQWSSRRTPRCGQTNSLSGRWRRLSLSGLEATL